MPRAAEARISRSIWWRRRRSSRSERSGAREASASRAARVATRRLAARRRERGERAQLAAGGGEVERDEGVGGVGRGRAGDGGDVVDQRPVDLVADGADHRQAQVGDGAAEVLVAERPQVGERAAAAADDGDVDGRDLGEAAKRAGDRAGGAAVLDRCVGPDDRPAPAAALEPGEQVGAGGRGARGDDADRLRDRGPRQGGLGLEQALGLELSPRAVELGEQVALAGEPDVGGAERERGRGGLRAGVVVGAAGDHDLGAVLERALGEPELVEVGVPDRARGGAVGVAELEVGRGARGAEVEDLADQEDPLALL